MSLNKPASRRSMHHTDRLRVNLIYSTDPRGLKVGGLETYVRDFVKFFSGQRLRVVGIDTVGDLKLRQWNTVFVGGKNVEFFPLFFEPGNANTSRTIPLSLRFVVFLFLYKSKIVEREESLDIRRVEHALPFLVPRKTNTLVQMIHGSSKYLLTKAGSRLERWRRIFLKLEQFVIRSADKVIVVNHQGEEYYRSRFPQEHEKIVRLSTWVDMGIFRPLRRRTTFRDAHRIARNATVLIFVGRLQDVKDPRLLFQVFAEVKKRVPETVLSFAGFGRFEEFIGNDDPNQDLLQTIRYLGVLQGSDLAEALSSSDVFVLTSKYEGMPRAVLEALSCGVPVVSVDVGDLSTIIKNGRNGFVVPDRDPRTIAGKVIPAARWKGRRRGACVHSVRGYRADVVISKVLRIHEEFRGNRHDGIRGRA